MRPLWWSLIAAANLAFCISLWRNRRTDHPWTLPYFVVMMGADALMLAVHPSGFDLLGLDGLVWVAISTAGWTSWAGMCALAGVRLFAGRLPAWVLVAVVLAWALCAMAGPLGASTTTRRLLMHGAFQPVCLIGAIVLIRYYVSRAIKRADRNGIDFLAFAVQATSIMQLIRLGTMLKHGILTIWASYVLYAIYFFVLVGYYIWKRRYLAQCLLSHS
jgi:hypothetical protein